MSAPEADHRFRPVVAALVAADNGHPDETWNEVHDFVYGPVAVAALAAADAADEAAGIYRVSLDAAIEAAARQDCDDWERCGVRSVHLKWAREALTAAVMGGAQ